MRPNRIALLSILIAAIVFTRYPVVFFPVWLVLFTFSRHPRSGVLLALGATAACGLLLVALQFSSHGWYWLHTVGLVTMHRVIRNRFFEGTRRLFALAPFVPLVPVVAVVLSFFRRLSPRAVLWVGLLLFSLPASLLPYAKLGGFSNDFVPAVFLIGPATAFVAADLLAALSRAARGDRRPGGARTAGVAFLWVRRYEPSRFIPSAQAFRRAEAFNARVKALEGGVVIPRHPFAPIHDGHDTLSWSDMPYLDMWWANYTDTDLAGYIDRIEPHSALLSGTEPSTAREMSKHFQLEERLDAPATLLGEARLPALPDAVERRREGRACALRLRVARRLEHLRGRVPDRRRPTLRRGRRNPRRGGQAPGNLVLPEDQGRGAQDNPLAHVPDRPQSHVAPGRRRVPARDAHGKPGGGARRADRDGNLRRTKS